MKYSDARSVVGVTGLFSSFLHEVSIKPTIMTMRRKGVLIDVSPE